MQKPITLKEYEKISTNDSRLACCDVKKLERYLDKTGFKNALKISANEIKAKYHVGVVKFKNTQFEILPKLIANSDNKNILKNLIFMLSYTKKLDIKTSDSVVLSQSKNPFLEVLIAEFANSLFDVLKRLTPKSYIREEENLNYLKGKLKFTENIRYNCANQAKFFCEYDEFSEECILNQLFYFVANCLYTISSNNRNKTVLKQIIDYFNGIKLIRFDRFKCQKIHLTRNQKLFEKPFKLAKMFVENSSVDLSKNKFENITMLWDMNKLFEEFIYQIIRKNKETLGISNVFFKKKKRLLVNLNNNEKRGKTEVDIMVEKTDETNKNKTKKKIIIDTKYKKFTEFEDVASDDIYQVCNYYILHNEKNNIVEKAILLYPKYENFKVTSINQYCINSENPFPVHFMSINLMLHDLRKDLQNGLHSGKENNSVVLERLKNIIDNKTNS